MSPRLFSRLLLVLPVACSPVAVDDKSTSRALGDTSAPADPGPPADDTDTDSDTAPPSDTAPDDTADTADTADTGAPDEPAPLTAAECFAHQLPADGEVPVDYDAWGPVMGSHCKATNHQDITGVERVVFVGDSITVGTPPTLSPDYYRNQVAEGLVTRFGLAEPERAWKNVNVIDGVVNERFSGDFAACAKWGARTDDIARAPHEQLQTCIPEEERHKVHLVVMTVGGNDLFAWAQDLEDGVDPAVVWIEAEQAVADLEAAVAWLRDDPSRFPAGVHVVFANNFAFTDVDSARDLSTCPGADLIGMDTGLVQPDFMEMATWMQGEMMRIAVQHGVDLAFMGEETCGHGHNRDDTTGRCYRGPETDLWFDITCMHPNAAGHTGIAELFLAAVDE